MTCLETRMVLIDFSYSSRFHGVYNVSTSQWEPSCATIGILELQCGRLDLYSDPVRQLRRNSVKCKYALKTGYHR